MVSGVYAQNNYATVYHCGWCCCSRWRTLNQAELSQWDKFFTNVNTAGTATQNTQRTAATNGQSFRTTASAKESLKCNRKPTVFGCLSSPNIPHNQMMVAYARSCKQPRSADGKTYQIATTCCTL
jgi:hypothetical protein